jgi:hypothetical protein
MFLSTSRYVRVQTVETKSAAGDVVALKLRRLTPLTGVSRVVQAGDRLDLLAYAVTGSGAQGWHVADANTALDARELLVTPGQVLRVPER